ncbi:MAG: polysaccharide biosynthesis C-terminal domain-containing protein [Bacteroidia bacterium]|nr:polysaccharide biosynthesis C-terminal domain-containing protein [Bacteroidia bacterium]
MGIVQRQSIQNTIYTYLGVILGWLNKSLLFYQWLTESQYGLIELLMTFMVLGSEFSQLGITKVILRFFPYFYEKRDKEGKFMFFITLYSVIGFAAICLILLLIKPFIVAQYGPKSPLFASEYVYIYPLILSYTLYRVLSTLSQSLLKTVVPAMAYNVALRIPQTLLIILFHYDYLTFRGFLNGMTLSFFVPVVIIGVYLIRLNQLRFSSGFDWMKGRIGRIMLNYGWYSSLGEMTNLLVGKVDILMLGWLVGEKVVATYAVAFYIAVLIQMPARSIRSITIPLIANHTKSRRPDLILELYQKTAITNLVVAALVFVGIWVNIDSFFALLPKYSDGRSAVILLGIGSLFNIITGLHRPIIVNSRYYRFDLYSNILLFIFVVVTDYVLIPPYGATGAALATAVSLFLYNGIGCLFVYLKFQMQPFTIKTLLNIAVMAVVLIMGLNLPSTGNHLLDIFVRSGVVTVVYLPLIFWLKISPDINKMMVDILKKVFGRFISR